MRKRWRLVASVRPETNANERALSAARAFETDRRFWTSWGALAAYHRLLIELHRRDQFCADEDGASRHLDISFGKE